METCPSTLLSHLLSSGTLAKFLDLPYLAFLLCDMGMTREFTSE